MPTLVNNLRAIRGPVTAVPMVAGKGVRIVPDVENNRFVVEADETVLYNVPVGTAPTTSASLSESAFNFERIRIVYGLDPSVISDSSPDYTTESELYLRPTITKYQIGATVYNAGSGNPLQIWGAEITISGSSINVTAGMRRWWTSGGGDNYKPYIYKIVGINRIANN
jgi:hypothetical protein